MKYGQIIFGVLNADVTVSGLVGTRIYPVLAKQNSDAPCIVFTKKILPIDNKGAANKMELVEFVLWCMDKNPDDADDLADAVRDALDRKSKFTQNGISVNTITFLGQGHEEYHDKLEMYMVPVNYKIRINKI